MFIQVIEGRTSDPEALHRQMDVWERELKPGAEGYLGSAGGCTADGSFIMAVRFSDRDAAMRNGARAAQSAWWRETERCLDGPATFHDTEDVHVMTNGRLEDAGFVDDVDADTDVDPDEVVAAADLSVAADDLQPLLRLERQWVPAVAGECEVLEADSPAALADLLIERLVADKTLQVGGDRT